ncbi:hypothetical protein SSX86_027972 [Deinandra increscens subsp. villosa]|uniref:F-box domain-containing protein n=1 Tax=Deinandra increscens subsp. villosa TaxID=3103831 RepID=A0AAP0GKV8_9ASTR
MKTTALDSSEYLVISNDDLLTEILFRLPVSSLVIFKSVSKRWINLITNPSFTLRRSQNPILEPPSGLFIQRENPFIYAFVPLDIKIPSPCTTFSLEFDSQKAEILQSCNGLILCRNMSHNLYVYNPSTNRSKPIPKPLLNASRFLNLRYRFTLQKQAIGVFVCDRFPFQCFRNGGFNNGIYWNGGIHWLDGINMVSLYMLDVEHPVLAIIETPRESLSGVYHQKLFESGGCLLLLCIGPFDSRQLSIYEMSKRCSSWSMKYIVNFDDIRVKYLKTFAWKRPERVCASVQCIVIGKKEEDSFLVIGIYGKMIKYNMVSKTTCKICDLDSLDSSDCFEFIASFAGV